MDEFSLIQTYFNDSANSYIAQNQKLAKDKSIVLAIGDDAAVFSLDDNQQLVSSHDTLLEGVHFPEDCKAEDIAYKALAVNLSDLAAMGAKPHSFTLSLALPGLDESWLARFSKSLFSLANQFELCLIGGDMVRGSLAISIHIHGTVEKGKFLTRSAVSEGDLLCVTGYLGLAALGLQYWQAEQGKSHLKAESLERFLRPVPRIEFAEALFESGIKACIDISDGFLADLSHMLKASACSAEIDWKNFALHDDLNACAEAQQQSLVFSGGDDYELCFAVSASQVTRIQMLARKMNLPLSIVGKALKSQECLIMNTEGQEIKAATQGYNHFLT